MITKRYNFDQVLIGIMRNFLRVDYYGAPSYIVPDIRNSYIRQYFIDGFEMLQESRSTTIFDLMMESKKLYLLSHYSFVEEVIELCLIQKGMK